MDKYDDIINLEHDISKKYKRMDIKVRAGMFSPFAALTGHKENIVETSRITNKKIELSEDIKENINIALKKINDNIKDKPLSKITYFIKDIKKEGGKYVTRNINIKKIDLYNNQIITIDNVKININDIIDISYEKK